jgi:sulfate permease, SulP family
MAISGKTGAWNVHYGICAAQRLLRPESGLFFANADVVRDAIRAQAVEGTKAVVLDAETVPTIDVTAVTMLVQLADDLRRDGVELVLARDVGRVRDLVRLGDSPLRIYPTVRAAVDALQAGTSEQSAR